MESMSDNKDHVQGVAQLLSDYQGEHTVAIDISEQSAFTDYFIITTVRSTGHLQGLVRRIQEYLEETELEIPGSLKRPTDSGWTLIDFGFMVVHLMTKEKRDFYELERVWFEGRVVYEGSSA